MTPPTSFTARVVRGHGVGRTLGFPTANLDSAPTKLPHGIYAGWVTDLVAPAERHAAAFYWGVRPTFAGTVPSFEAYLVDGNPDLYEHTLRIELVAFIRNDQTFPSPEALADQMTKDVADVRQHLSQTSNF